MSDSISNWVSGDANKAQVENAQQVLEKFKRIRYSKDKKYKLVRMDTPGRPAYKEVLMTSEEIAREKANEEIVDEDEVLNDDKNN